MARHVRSCRGRPSGAGVADGPLLALEDRCLPSYWLVSDALPATTWDDLDMLLGELLRTSCSSIRPTDSISS